MAVPTNTSSQHNLLTHPLNVIHYPPSPRTLLKPISTLSHHPLLCFSDAGGGGSVPSSSTHGSNYGGSSSSGPGSAHYRDEDDVSLGGDHSTTGGGLTPGGLMYKITTLCNLAVYWNPSSVSLESLARTNPLSWQTTMISLIYRDDNRLDRSQLQYILLPPTLITVKLSHNENLVGKIADEAAAASVPLGNPPTFTPPTPPLSTFTPSLYLQPPPSTFNPLLHLYLPSLPCSYALATTYSIQPALSN